MNTQGDKYGCCLLEEAYTDYEVERGYAYMLFCGVDPHTLEEKWETNCGIRVWKLIGYKKQCVKFND